MSKITEEEVRHVANLSKLEFNDQEVTAYAEQLGKIIEMIDLLNEVDTEGVEFTSNVANNTNFMREDVSTPGWNRDELMRNVPESEDGFIKVPAILDGGGDA
ncbi:Asp-tRNA(Asn)/Glu-tRNA(Gln) amidotransferase subunit GatC [Floricoccus penangensis]|uniref:Aspartyl/glutamyl-tRNA(Asn/Gln) amidotransferase subunit C n=1 Tax=Floricoccus penangensis TaxID=1859475 RepID=A0A9Q5NYP9_9LACT|nr:Asp-tRNA(Asn)/Glu-tRNA(Gln) amidotransferase subunit GatC [Floricoccus penangensis]OFI45796.1 asparaginyl/glutamyl-tRNA amidotransferase subunit C [Floricoccus penangensis]URZ88025.1 Asp-tRNA(Asn)/Glu-tRNA(Gln) amidotransferase subunit GatC [Floricoccus penangensis]